MTKISKQIISENKILIRIQGETKDVIKGVFWKFVNYGPAVKMRACYFDKYDKGVDIEDFTGFNFLNDFLFNDGYFRTDLVSLVKTLEGISLFEILRLKDPENKWDIIPARIEKEAQLLAVKKFNDIPEEDVLNTIDRDINNE